MDQAGGCLCGAIRYRVSLAPRAVSHCHCTFCRRASGAAFMTWMTLPSAGFAYILGAPALVDPDDHVWVETMLPWFDFSGDGLAKLDQAHWQLGYPKKK